MTTVSSSIGSAFATDNRINFATMADTPPEGVDSVTWNLSSPSERESMLRGGFSTMAEGGGDDATVIGHQPIVIDPLSPGSGGDWSGGGGGEAVGGGGVGPAPGQGVGGNVIDKVIDKLIRDLEGAEAREAKISEPFSDPSIISSQGRAMSSDGSVNVQMWTTKDGSIYYDMNGNGRPDYKTWYDTSGHLWGDDGRGPTQLT
jgi:hypothetical protein